MSLRMQLKRIVIMMIIEYVVPNHLWKCSHLFLYMHEKQIPKYKSPRICMKCPHTSHVEVDQFLNSQHAWPCWDMGSQRKSFSNSQTDSQMYTFPDQMNWQFVQILMDSQFHSKLRVLDTGDTSLFFVLYFLFFIFCSGSRENLLGIVSRLLFFCFTPSVSGTQNKRPKTHHNHPRHPFNTKIYSECKAQNRRIL